jgi:methionine aminopeptidase
MAACSDLGCHIDGFIASHAQTIVVAADFDAPVTGKAADVISAARTCFDAAIRLIRPGKSVADVSKTLDAIAQVYGCNLVEGVMTHQMKQFTIDANKCVLNKISPEHRVENEEFEENEVYAIDIVVSTGANRRSG